MAIQAENGKRHFEHLRVIHSVSPISVLAEAVSVVCCEHDNGITWKVVEKTGKLFVQKLCAGYLVLKCLVVPTCHAAFFYRRPAHSTCANINRAWLCFSLERIRSMGFPKIDETKKDTLKKVMIAIDILEKKREELE